MKQRDRHQWVLETDVDPFSKALLHVFAHRVDADSLTCYTSMERLARDAGMSERKARTLTADLEQRGFIVVIRSTGRSANRYRLNPAQCAELTSTQPGTACPVNGTPTRHARYSNPAPQVVNPAQRAPEQEEQDLTSPSATASVWDLWVAIAGVGKRSMLGKLIAEYGEDAVAEGVAITSTKRPADPASYIRGILSKKNSRRNVHSTDREIVSPL